jgi:hypothetical protein
MYNPLAEMRRILDDIGVPYALEKKLAVRNHFYAGKGLEICNE